MDAILRALMRDLDHSELIAMYLVYMRRLTIPGAAKVADIRPDRMRTFERRLRDKVFPELTLNEARDPVAALYEGLPRERQDEVVRYLIGLMPAASETKEVLLVYHRSQ